MEKKPYFPMFMDISEKRIVVAGGGRVALRRASILVRFCNHITVIAPQILEEFRQLDEIRLCQREIVEVDLEEADIVCILTDQPDVNEQVYTWGRKRGLLISHGGERQKSDFYFPGIAQTDEVVVGVTAGGRNHLLAKEMTEYIRKCLEQYEA